MDLNEELLQKLSDLELELYSANISDLGELDYLRENLLNTPVEMKVTAEKGICEDQLYDICLKYQGEHDSLATLRLSIANELANQFAPPGWNMLSVLFDGVYVGDPEDLCL